MSSPSALGGAASLAAPSFVRAAPSVRGRSEPDPTATASVSGRVIDAPELVQLHSEHPDRIAGGDIGTWSNRELTHFPWEVEALDQLEVGEVAPPFDSLFGIELVMRVPNPERVSYAIEGAQLYFDRAAPAGDPQSLASVQAEAQTFSQALRRDPAKLEALAQRYGQYRDQWWDGRGLPELTAAIRKVAVGEALLAPAQSGPFIVIGLRVAPRTEAPIATLIDLPARSGG